MTNVEKRKMTRIARRSYDALAKNQGVPPGSCKVFSNCRSERKAEYAHARRNSDGKTRRVLAVLTGIPADNWKSAVVPVSIAPRFDKARAHHLSGSLVTLHIMTAFATSPLADTARLYAEAAAQAVAETLWPTRCAICDEPGELLCERCRSELPFIDLWRACPICGAPWGHTQCTECNRVMLAATGRKAVAFSSLASPFELAESTRRIAVVYKDGGEQRLATEMARYMARYLSSRRSRAKWQGSRSSPPRARPGHAEGSTTRSCSRRRWRS